MLTKKKVQFTAIFSLLISFSIYAQTDSSSATSSIDLIYGYRMFNQNFSNQFNTTTNLSYKNPVQLGGLQISDNKYVNKYLDYYGAISYRQVIPQNILVQNITSKVNGFVFGLDYGLSLGVSNKFKVLVGIGFNTGRMKLHADNQIDLKNPFFSPKISIQPKLVIKKLVLSVRAEYDFDISKTDWRKRASSSTNTVILNNFKQSGFTPLFCIGMLI